MHENPEKEGPCLGLYMGSSDEEEAKVRMNIKCRNIRCTWCRSKVLLVVVLQECWKPRQSRKKQLWKREGWHQSESSPRHCPYLKFQRSIKDSRSENVSALCPRAYTNKAKKNTQILGNTYALISPCSIPSFVHRSCKASKTAMASKVCSWSCVCMYVLNECTLCGYSYDVIYDILATCKPDFGVILAHVNVQITVAFTISSFPSPWTFKQRYSADPASSSLIIWSRRIPGRLPVLAS